MIDLPGELDALLASWRTCRASETAHLIDELSSWFALVLPSLGGKKRAERQHAWLLRAERQSAIDLPRLLETVGYGTAAEVTQQLEVLAAWPADPRMTWLAKRMFATPRHATSSGDQKIWRRLFNLLENHADARAIAFIDPGSMSRVFDGSSRGLGMRARAATVYDWVAKHDAPLADRAAHEALVARITHELDTGRALRDAVRMEADDTEQPSRLVYLDWLMERGYVPSLP
ncbi:MAG: hypothetical protein M4D80_38730 [Myxococcota bacterium]|nr:hypothetical protein [Myxococcota bacterium]